MMRKLLFIALLSSTFVSAQAPNPDAKSDVQITGAWARATVPGQAVSGAYMRIKSGTPLKLVKAESSVAAMVEIHNMSMTDGVMSMSAVEAIELPAGKTVELKPGGYHIMLMQLKSPIQEGGAVPIVLTFEDGKKQRRTVNVSAKGQAKAAADHHH
jgi:periplasmic copper chaperone A